MLEGLGKDTDWTAAAAFGVRVHLMARYHSNQGAVGAGTEHSALALHPSVCVCVCLSFARSNAVSLISHHTHHILLPLLPSVFSHRIWLQIYERSWGDLELVEGYTELKPSFEARYKVPSAKSLCARGMPCRKLILRIMSSSCSKLCLRSQWSGQWRSRGSSAPRRSRFLSLLSSLSLSPPSIPPPGHCTCVHV